MKKHLLSVVCLAALVASTGASSGQIYSPISGNLFSSFQTGSNLFANPLQTGDNTLHGLFPPSTTPAGTTVSLWDSATLSFDTNSILTNGTWSLDLTLPPGIGALVVAPSPFTILINGYVLNHDGTFLINDLVSPSTYTGPNGTYLLGDKAPIPDTGTNIFLNIIGRFPYPGEQVTTLTGTSTYQMDGSWDVMPTLGVGESAFLTIISEPQPLLTIIRADNLAVVSWSPSVTGWTLQTNTDLTSGTWGNYAGPVINNIATNVPPSGNMFFRLMYP